MFGARDVRPRERRGVKCQRVAHITNQPGVLLGSISPLAAVQVVATERAAGRAVVANDRFDAASFEEIEGFYAHLGRNLIRSVPRPGEPAALMERLRRLCRPGRLEKEEVEASSHMSSWDNEGGR